MLNPTTQPLGPIRFNNASVRDILTFIGEHGDQRHLRSRLRRSQITVNVDGVTLEQALQQIMLTNQLFYKVLNEHDPGPQDNARKARSTKSRSSGRSTCRTPTRTEMAQMLNT